MAFYKRKLPHWQPKSAEFFITFRLAGSLPAEVVDKLKFYREQLQKVIEPVEQKEILRKVFQKYEGLLDKVETGPDWLKDERIAQIVQEALHFYDNKSYDLYAYTIMSNHVRIVLKLLDIHENSYSCNDDYPITKLLHSVKSYTALECNRLLGRKGAFWQSESFDRVIRDQNELEKTIRYTLNNPVKAGLVDYWKDWSFNYCKSEFAKSLM